MEYMALVSFTGKITMQKGEVRSISNPTLVKDLLKANYIKKVTKKRREDKK